MIRAQWLVARLREETHPGRFLVSRLLVRSRLCRLLRLRASFEGGRLWFHPTMMSANLWVDPNAYERDGTLATLRSVLRPGDVLVDVGAHVGLHSLTGAKIVGEHGRVVSLEPHPTTFEYLTQNLALNGAGNVEPHQLAASGSSGEQPFSDRRLEDRNGLDPAGPIVVPVTTLDSLLADVHRIRLLKIDVEGAELSVLAGATEVLLRTDAVLVEAWDPELVGAQLGQFTTSVVSVGPGYVNLLAVRGSSD